MEDYIRELLNRYQYSDEIKEAVAFRVLIGDEDAKLVMQESGIPSIQTIHHWVAGYQQKIEQGLTYLPPMNEKQYQAALKQRNKDLEEVLQEVNLMILVLHTMIEAAERDLKISVRKKAWYQTVLKLQYNQKAKVSVGGLCRMLQ